MVNPGKTADYALSPTSASGQASWTNGATNYGKAATFGTGANQLLDPAIEHSAGKPLCAARNQPWFDFGGTSVASPYLKVTCTLPPVPGQPTYNANMNKLLDAAVNDHSLMAALDAASTDDQLIAVAAGSIAGLPAPNPEPGPTVQQTIKVTGAGTIKVVAGDIQWITNDSGHFKPSQDNLKNSIQAVKAAGFPNFPPLGSCTYDFKPVPGKDGVYSQSATTNSHCEL